MPEKKKKKVSKESFKALTELKSQSKEKKPRSANEVRKAMYGKS